MKKLMMILMVTGFIAVPAYAWIRRLDSDVKPATQQMTEKQTFTTHLAATTNTTLSGNAGATSAAAATVTTFAGQPDSPRNLVITPGGTTGDVESCVIVVNGTNIKNAAISENFTFAADANTAQTGSKAFKTVTSVVFPANCESGGFAATWSVGLGEKIGLKNCLDQAGHIFFSTLNGAKEATAPTMAASSTAVESNTADFNGTMNGTNDFELFYIQNYRCL